MAANDGLLVLDLPIDPNELPGSAGNLCASDPSEFVDHTITLATAANM